MLVRLVKMTFNVNSIETFKEHFDSHKTSIRQFEGCQKLHLLQDKHKANIFFTYSYWKSEKDLENYRTSMLFKTVWAKTKPLFSAKPEAWSLDNLVSLD